MAKFIAVLKMQDFKMFFKEKCLRIRFQKSAIVCQMPYILNLILISVTYDAFRYSVYDLAGKEYGDGNHGEIPLSTFWLISITFSCN